MPSDALNIIRGAVDGAFYRAAYGDVLEADVDPAVDYLEKGWRAGRDPCSWFSTNAYLNSYGDVAEVGVNPLYHYLRYGFWEGREIAASSLSPELTLVDPEAQPVVSSERNLQWPTQIRARFDYGYYASQIKSDLSLSEDQLIDHYYQSGVIEGLDPHPEFSTNYYLEYNTDVRDAGVNPFEHFVLAGEGEGRSPSRAAKPEASEPQPSKKARTKRREDKGGGAHAAIAAEFDREFYLARYPDVAAAGVDPIEHYINAGWAEGRNPSETFSTRDYLELNPDVAAAGVNPFLHYIRAGRAEGRPVKQDLGFRYDIIADLTSLESRVKAYEGYKKRSKPTKEAVLAGAVQAALGASGKLFVSVSHDDFMANLGGVQLCLRRESQAAIDSGYAHIHIFPDLPLPVLADEPGRSLGILINRQFAGYTTADRLTRWLQDAALQESVLTVHSLLGHNVDDVAAIAHALPARASYFWTHDYAAVCAGYNLLRNDVEFCGAPSLESKSCEICVYLPRRAHQNSQHRRLFETVPFTVLAPSESALAIWSKSDLPHVASRVVPHCTLDEVRQLETWSARRSEIRVGYVGFPAAHKGWPVFEELLQLHRDDDRYRFLHLGAFKSPGARVDFVEVHVADSAPDSMRAAIEANDLDVVVLWSICAETFCLVAYEAVAGGALLIARRDSGNLAAFVQSSGCGATFDDEDAMFAFLQGDGLSEMLDRRRGAISSLRLSALTMDVVSEIGVRVS